MKVARIGLVFGLTTLVASGALAQKVTTDYARDVDFGRYKTFMWIKEPKVGDPLLKQRIVDDINQQLAARGYRLVTEGADLGVTAHLATQTEKTLNTFCDGFGGGWRWGGGFGSATTTVDTYQEGTLVVDLFDTATKQAIWRGTAQQTVSSNPQKQAANMAKAAQKMFTRFPQ